MPDYQVIYGSRAADYERLISREDYQGNILPALQQICSLHDLTVVELGAGTGRFTRLLLPYVEHISAFDISHHMLRTAWQKLSDTGRKNWLLTTADHRALPLTRSSADLAIAGWTLGHFPRRYPDTWQGEIGRALAEMNRVLRPGGTIVLLETLGTGRETPLPPTAALAAYYRWLESEYGFKASWIRTDYRFRDQAEATRLLSFFFGRDLSQPFLHSRSPIVPECTGIWWLTL